jgi:hypothetical protein
VSNGWRATDSNACPEEFHELYNMVQRVMQQNESILARLLERSSSNGNGGGGGGDTPGGSESALGPREIVMSAGTREPVYLTPSQSGKMALKMPTVLSGKHPAMHPGSTQRTTLTTVLSQQRVLSLPDDSQVLRLDTSLDRYAKLAEQRPSTRSSTEVRSFSREGSLNQQQQMQLHLHPHHHGASQLQPMAHPQQQQQQPPQVVAAMQLQQQPPAHRPQTAPAQQLLQLLPSQPEAPLQGSTNGELDRIAAW